MDMHRLNSEISKYYVMWAVKNNYWSQSYLYFHLPSLSTICSISDHVKGERIGCNLETLKAVKTSALYFG